MRLLILGGTTEASALAHRIAGRNDLHPMLSLAGRTRSPAPPPISYRVGGFGGVAGLRDFLRSHAIDAVIDATHPFSVQMSRNAAVACAALALPLAILSRPAWHLQEGDCWTSVADMPAAVRALGTTPRTVFLTVGGLQVAAFADAPQHGYLVRTIDRPDTIDRLPSHRLILARGPFSVADEVALMRQEQVDVLVTKNSGGTATEAKLDAARALGIEVVMVERAATGVNVERAATLVVPQFTTTDDILAWIEAHRPAP